MYDLLRSGGALLKRSGAYPYGFGKRIAELVIEQQKDKLEHGCCFRSQVL